jgi:Fe2+ or Zn2+ uptake regulation protein
LDTSLDSQSHQSGKNSGSETTKDKLIQRINQQLENADIQTVRKVLKSLESEG